MDKTKRKQIIELCITILLGAAVIITGSMSIYTYVSEKQAGAAYDSLRSEVVAEVETDDEDGGGSSVVEEVAVEKHYPELTIDFDALTETNPDFVGWLYFPALDISYPIVQGEDNSYYLKRSFEGEKMNAGCIFLDCEASTDFSDRNSFLFGHNMRDGSMFGAMRQLLDGTVEIDDAPYFYIYTEDKVYIYRIFAYYKTRSTSDRYATFTSDESYDAYVAEALELSDFSTDCDFSTRGNIMSLSTCYGAGGTKNRNLLHGMLEEVAEVVD